MHKADRFVDLVGPLDVLHEHLTAALCENAWDEVRVHERRRKWSLELIVKFWAAVVVAAPPSLRFALAEAAGNPRGPYPAPEASPQAFFARSQGLSWRFFQAVFEGFLARATAGLRAGFAQELAPIRDRFTALVAIDGSGLDQVARRLRLLWNDRSVPLPGSVLALYDLCRGVLMHLGFAPDFRTAEFNRALEAVARVPRGSLLVGDRLYGVPKFFAALSALGLFGLTRRFSPVRLVEKVRVSRKRVAQGRLEDWDVLAGSPQHEPQRLRLIRLRKGKRTILELFTNVLDRSRLSAAEALMLYRTRWKVERLFSDLKEVLNLKRFYGANVNAVGMQVFAAAIVHTALRIAQGEVAAQAGIPPEAISTKKFFPKVSAASCALSAARLTVVETQDLNPGIDLKTPDMRRMPFARALLSTILVETRSDRRRKRRRCLARTEWRSLPQPKRRKKPPLS